MPGLFITATGTDIGKTYIAAGLISAARRAGLTVDAFKPVMSGFDENAAEASDAGHLLKALGCDVTPAAVARLSPWRFAAPLAPDAAAAAEGRTLDFSAVVAACRAAAMSTTIIEGVGGVMAPLDESHTILDLIAAVELPVLLVSSTELGAISHCLTACTALRSRGIAPALIALNQVKATMVPIDATARTVARFNPRSKVFVVSRDAADGDFDRLFREDVGPELSSSIFARS